MVAKSKTKKTTKRTTRTPRASQKELDEIKERLNEVEERAKFLNERKNIEREKVKKLAQILLNNLPGRKLRRNVSSFCAEDGEDCGYYKDVTNCYDWTLRKLLTKLVG